MPMAVRQGLPLIKQSLIIEPLPYPWPYRLCLAARMPADQCWLSRWHNSVYKSPTGTLIFEEDDYGGFEICPQTGAAGGQAGRDQKLAAGNW
jgi:hypothetical protein